MATTILKFPSADAVRVALPLIPADVLAAGGLVHETDDGSIVVAATMPAAVRKQLVEAGAEVVKSPGRGGRPFAHWTELVPLIRDPEFDLRDVLFVLPPGAPWLPLAAELVRLGCDAVDLARLERDDWVLRTRRPPFYTVARAATGDWTAYWRQGPVYVEVGHRHPLADQLPTPEGDTLVLVSRDGLRVVRPGGWTELLQRMELVLPPPIEVPAGPPTERLTVRMRLKPAPRAATPMLWRIAPPVDAALDELLAVLPESVTDRLSFARFTLADGTDGALLRARPGTVPPALEGLEPYTPHPQLPAVHLPAGRTIDPPLHARTLAALLDPPLGELAWIEPTAGDGIQLHRVREEAFQPLGDWVVYHADRDAARVEAWLGSAVFDWAPLDLPIARDERAPEARQDQPRAARQAAPATFDRPATPAVEVVPVTVAPTVQVQVAAPVVSQANDLERALATLQDQVKADPRRDDLWAPMAELHHALGQHREASLCWSRALWDQPAPARRTLAAQWVSLLPRGTGELAADPGTVEMTGVVARALASDDAFDPPALQRWLEANDRPLDVRSRWLVRRRAAELAGGDALALARGRDEVLSSIRAGLAPWRDVPAFLRTSTTEEERRWLASSLGGLMGKLEPLVPNEAPKHCTRAYATLIVAWAQACLGLDAPVREALDAAERALPLSDAIHRVLLGLYRSGIEEALHGLPSETPPPPEVTAQLDALEAFDRYKIQRLQDQSVAVLAQAGAADAFSNWVRRETRATFAGMPTEQLLPAIRAALDRLDGGAAGSEPPGPMLLEILGAAAGLDEAHGLGVLERVVQIGVGLPAEPRLSVLVEATSLAAALNRPEVLEAAGVLDALRQAFVAQVRAQPKSIVDPARDLARSLARCRLTQPGIALYGAIREAVPAAEAAVRLRVSGALAQLGGNVGNEAQEALTLLANPQLARAERLAIVAATADLATPLPVDQAVALWNALVPQAAIADAFSTNTHFALSFLQVVEILAAAHVHPDRLLGPEGRARIEADEHRVRQRIHREERL